MKKPIPIWENKKDKVLTEESSDAIDKYCQYLYNKNGGYSAICDYANEYDLPYGDCKPCENEMPMLITTKTQCCAVCGS